MNEQLQKQLADLLAKLVAVAQDAGNFAANQIPPLVQEKIRIGRIEVVGSLVVDLFIAYVAVQLLRWCASLDFDIDRHGGVIPASIGGGALAILALAFTVMDCHIALLVWFAPRLYIVEWLKDMVAK